MNLVIRHCLQVEVTRLLGLFEIMVDLVRLLVDVLDVHDQRFAVTAGILVGGLVFYMDLGSVRNLHLLDVLVSNVLMILFHGLKYIQITRCSFNIQCTCNDCHAHFLPIQNNYGGSVGFVFHRVWNSTFFILLI